MDPEIELFSRVGYAKLKNFVLHAQLDTVSETHKYYSFLHTEHTINQFIITGNFRDEPDVYNRRLVPYDAILSLFLSPFSFSPYTLI